MEEEYTSRYAAKIDVGCVPQFLVKRGYRKSFPDHPGWRHIEIKRMSQSEERTSGSMPCSIWRDDRAHRFSPSGAGPINYLDCGVVFSATTGRDRRQSLGNLLGCIDALR